MQPFTNFESRIVPLPINNVDTDQIIPARFLKTISKQGLDQQLFYDWRQQTGFMVTTAALSATVIALILFLIVRQINRQNREAQQRLEAERGRLDTARLSGGRRARQLC